MYMCGAEMIKLCMAVDEEDNYDKHMADLLLLKLLV